jgi:glycosyltransferase involved in cell wall biosynthesis
MGIPDPRGARADVEPGVDPVIADKARRAACRARHGIAPDAVVLAAFGLVTPEKRISQALHVLPDVARVVPSVQLLLVGETAPHYDVLAEARTLGVDDRITITGYVPDEELPTYLAIADVCLCLRWPTGRETSASWLRALAAGRPTIITDLAHTDEIPSLDPRTWLLQPAGSGDAAAEPSPRAACVSIDILDERHSLGLAMRRLATDAALRDRLGYAARAFWEDHHTLACMVEDYERAIARTLELPVRRPAGLPAHLLEDGTAQVRQMVKALGVRVDFLEEKDAAQG